VLDIKIRIPESLIVNIKLLSPAKNACTVNTIEKKIQEAPYITEKTHKQRNGIKMSRNRRRYVVGRGIFIKII